MNTLTEMVDAAALYLKGWRPRGRRLVSISNSGAVCVLSADAATDAGLALAPLAEATQAELRTILPGFATTTNPVDITAALLTNSSLFGAILPAIGRDPAADAFFVGVAVAGAALRRRGVRARQRAFRGRAPASRSWRRRRNAASPSASRRTASSRSPPRARRFARSASSWRMPNACRGRGSRTRRDRSDAQRLRGCRMLDEASSLRVLAERGVPVVPHRVCTSAAEARDAFGTLRAPGTPGTGRVVVKGCSAHVAHKSELGIVRIGLDSADRVEAAYHDIVETAARAGATLDGVIVAQMVRGLRELMVGAHVDPTFGPVLVVGDGGKYVEVMPDVATVLAPFTPARIERALRRLRIAPLLDGVRGDPPMDVAAFCRAAAAVGALVTDRSTGVTAVDVNPVIVGARGEGCVAVDAAVWREIAL